MPILQDKMFEALESRRKRQILRRLPDPVPSSDSTQLIDFCSNDYLSLSSFSPLRTRFIEKIRASDHVLGSGGSRLLVNPLHHQKLEDRLLKLYFDLEHICEPGATLLFNSGFDANAGLFASIPQDGDVVVMDEYIHASVHDGVRASRASKSCYTFAHNDMKAFRQLLERVRSDSTDIAGGRASVIIAVEALYSMDGTFAPLPEIVALVDELLPLRNGHIIVDEAHATGIYGPNGRGITAHYRLEDRVFARLVTFGKALAGNGAVVLTSPLVKSYLLNYARPLLYTTALSNSAVIAVDCSFDLLEDGTATQLANKLRSLIRLTLTELQSRLKAFPPHLVHLPHELQDRTPSPIGDDDELLSPIIPVMTSQPRSLSQHLSGLGVNAKPITWPTVPKGKDRVRVCLHAGLSMEDVMKLVHGIVGWAEHQNTIDQRAWYTEQSSLSLPSRL